MNLRETLEAKAQELFKTSDDDTWDAVTFKNQEFDINVYPSWDADAYPVFDGQVDTSVNFVLYRGFML